MFEKFLNILFKIISTKSLTMLDNAIIYVI